jgi:diadenosine tetraphosphate (Ap4A) HIT family hydrolase
MPRNSEPRRPVRCICGIGFGWLARNAPHSPVCQAASVTSSPETEVSVSSPPCPFCDKLRALEQLPEHEIIWQFPTSVAFLGVQQFYRGYCVLVSRAHATELSQLDGEELPSFLAEMCLLAQAIEEGFSPRKLNYELLGNQVPHLHWHLFPRPTNDPDPLFPVWLTLHRAESDAALKAQLEGTASDRPEIARLLRHHLDALQAPTA